MHSTLNNLGPPKDIGDRPTFTATFRDDAGELADPDTVYFKLQTPDGAEVPYEWNLDDEVVRVSLGVFEFLCPILTQAGKHVVRAKSTAGYVAAEEGWFLVRRSAFTAP